MRDWIDQLRFIERVTIVILVFVIVILEIADILAIADLGKAVSKMPSVRHGRTVCRPL